LPLLFWIASKVSVAILAKRRSIIDVIATALRLRDDVVNIDANLVTSATAESRHLIYLVLQGLRKWHFEWPGSWGCPSAIIPARNCTGTHFEPSAVRSGTVRTARRRTATQRRARLRWRRSRRVGGGNRPCTH